MSKKCLLSCLESPRLAGVMPGLDLSGSLVRLIPQEFQCCNSMGMMLVENGGVRRCDVLRRIQGVQRLLGQFEDIWGRQRLSALFQFSVDVDQLLWVKNYKDSEPNGEGSQPFIKGKCVRGDRSQMSPSQMWAVALAATWRYGLRVHMVSFGKTRHRDYFPPEPPGGDQSKLIFMIEGIDKLWTPEKAFEFETLVGWCDRAQTPLWSEFLLDPIKIKRAQQVKTSIRAKFSRRISEQKNRAPLDWVQADCLSRLMTLSSDVGHFRGVMDSSSAQ